MHFLWRALSPSFSSKKTPKNESLLMMMMMMIARRLPHLKNIID
jgi:hypothetical protein